MEGRAEANNHVNAGKPSSSSSSSSAVPLSPQNVESLFNSVEAFLFDCDGVIWKGDTLIDGVLETLEMLRSKGKKMVFVTNNSTKSRNQYAKKFCKLGIHVNEEEIFSSSFAAAMYLKINDFPQEKKVYVIGGEGILEELETAGFTALGGPEDGKKTVELKPNCLFEHDKSVGAVVVGLDKYINYYKLQYATLCIRENPGCLFIATNRDAVGHMTDLQEWPGAGCMVAAVSGSTEREPIVVGKPSTFMMDFLLQKFQISTSKMCMVGDRLDTDILFGQNSGCKTLLVLSGVTTLSSLQDPSNNIQPDYYATKTTAPLHDDYVNHRPNYMYEEDGGTGMYQRPPPPPPQQPDFNGGYGYSSGVYSSPFQHVSHDFNHQIHHQHRFEPAEEDPSEIRHHHTLLHHHHNPNDHTPPPPPPPPPPTSFVYQHTHETDVGDEPGYSLTIRDGRVIVSLHLTQLMSSSY